MRRVKGIFLCISFLFPSFLGREILSAAEKSCRNLGTTVLYERPLTDVESPYDCKVLRVVSRGPEQIVTIACPPGPRSAFSLGQSSNWESKDGGRSWYKMNENIPSQFPFTLFQPVWEKSVLYRYISELGLFLRSDDGGTKWSLPQFRIEGLSPEQFVEHSGGGKFHEVFFFIAAADPHNPLKLYASISLYPWGNMVGLSDSLNAQNPQVIALPGLYESSDGAETWKKSMKEPSNKSPLGISALNPEIMFAVGKDGVIKSGNGGKDWDPVGQNADLLRKPLLKSKTRNEAANEDFEVSEFAIDPTESRSVFIVSNKGFYRSLDGGRNWCLLDLGFDELDAARSLVFNPRKPEELFLGSARGVFRSTDRGEHSEKIFPPAGWGNQKIPAK
jgi:hypothetical protein